MKLTHTPNEGCMNPHFVRCRRATATAKIWLYFCRISSACMYASACVGTPGALSAARLSVRHEKSLTLQYHQALENIKKAGLVDG
jgi:hypothetical protein